MTNHSEPLYVGCDVDALLARLDQDDRDRIVLASQRAVGIQPDASGDDRLRRSAGRRTTSRLSLLAEDTAARVALAGEGGVAIRNSLVA
jgi:hypothetical protein